MTELTDRKIMALKVDKRTEIADQSYTPHPRKLRRGLMLLVSPTGRRTWMLKKAHHGKRVKLKLGEYPELSLAQARELFDDIVASDQPPSTALAIHSSQPDSAASPATLTVDRLVKKFIEEDAEPHNKSWKEQQRVLQATLVERYGTLPADSITTDHIERIINDLLDEGKAGAAKEALKQIGTCYAWATGTKRNRRRVVARSEVRRAVKQVSLLSIQNPAESLTVPQYHQRSYHFKNSREFLPKLKKSNIRDDIKNVLQLQYETFARVGEVAGLPWSEIDLRKRQWLLPAERSKTGMPHLIMLSKQSVALLKSLKNDSDYVFPKPTRKKPLDTDDVVKGINKARSTLKVNKDFSSHSLRHTGRTWLASQGCPSEVSERLLNHSVADMGDMSKRYDHHEYEKEKRLWTKKWCDYLAG